MQLPEDFIRSMREQMGDQLFDTLASGLQEPAPVSIRLNPGKCRTDKQQSDLWAADVPWCETGIYLKERPNFTFDPLLHAGVYYVQEAASMFTEQVLRQYVKEPVRMLDLCAAPGGKTTCAAAALPAGSMLCANEPVHSRASILSENVQKWMLGEDPHTAHVTRIGLTNNYPAAYRKAKVSFDVILADVPCSGEGMFRKDEEAVRDWSTDKVDICRRLQRKIVETVWPCLRPGGLLLYSTCTFNVHENEENVKWCCEQMGAEVLPVEAPASWNIIGSLLQGYGQPVSRFIPGNTRSEGLFMAVLRKAGESAIIGPKSLNTKGLNVIEPMFLNDIYSATGVPHIGLSYRQAVAYLRREAIVLAADAPRGLFMATYRGYILGLGKNVGNRANNLYPKEWRIKSTYLPEEPVNVIGCGERV